jgi:hypothetical protein
MYNKTRLALQATVFFSAVLMFVGSVHAGTTTLNGRVFTTGGKGIAGEKIKIVMIDKAGITFTFFSDPNLPATVGGAFSFSVTRADTDWPVDANGVADKTITLEFWHTTLSGGAKARVLMGLAGDTPMNPIYVTIP